MGHRIAQSEFGQMVFNHSLTAPSGNAACQISCAVSIGIKSLGDFRVLQIAQVLHTSGVGRRINQISLQSTFNIASDFAHFFSTTRFFEECFMQRVPMDRGKVTITGTKRQMDRLVFHFLRLGYFVAQHFQRLIDNLMLEFFFQIGPFDRTNRNTFTRHH